MNFDEWLAYGYSQKWVGPAVCYTHDGLPLSESEDEEFLEGDPCIHVLRLYESAEHKAEIEENHSPSQWRASNSGLGATEDLE